MKSGIRDCHFHELWTSIGACKCKDRTDRSVVFLLALEFKNNSPHPKRSKQILRVRNLGYLYMSIHLWNSKLHLEFYSTLNHR